MRLVSLSGAMKVTVDLYSVVDSVTNMTPTLAASRSLLQMQILALWIVPMAECFREAD